MNKKTLIYSLIMILLAVGIAYSAKTKSSVNKTSDILQIPAQKIFELSVKNGKIVSGQETITVHQGDDVAIKITVDQDEELHLHGYDKMIDLQKDVQGELSFKATISGRFEYELERSGTEIGALEVLPQ